MTPKTMIPILAAGLTLSVLVSGTADAHEIQAVHVHGSHLAQGLVLAAVVAAAGGLAWFLAAGKRRR